MTSTTPNPRQRNASSAPARLNKMSTAGGVRNPYEIRSDIAAD